MNLLHTSHQYVVGIDLGGTKIAAALFDPAGAIISREQMETSGARTAEEVVQRMVSMIRTVSAGYPLAGVGLASPGAVDSREGIALNGTNLPEWNHVPLKKWMEKDLGVEVKVVNDANAAAWCEYVHGAGKGAENMVYITFSTGVGAGIVLDGKLLLGSRSFAGELGHTVIDPNGAPCSCGNRGCWETFASGTAIRDYALSLMRERESLIRTLAEGQGEAVSAKHVFEAQKQGDAVAIDVIRRAVHYMGLGLANVIHTFNPDRIVIGGGVSRAGDQLFPALRAETERFVMAPYRQSYTLVPAGLNDDVGLIGAAALFHTNPPQSAN
ncbi:ROK family protein [Paenibacillus macerans]|uniref:ROK family protein n=1 Tax=Paenibacillus macerans TaxID=44252 RepID=UPI00203BCB96|nr:ROK family protein [Paenibacillus macerans]MCM3703962.1 ROK family protein [Paenibacillus macerans]